jgi:hypothetical protein
MTISLIKPAELPFAGVLFHQGFEALQADDWMKPIAILQSG